MKTILAMRFMPLLLIAFLAPHQSLAETENNGLFQLVTLYFENDAFFGTDYLYTNGIKIALTSVEPESSEDDKLAGLWAHPLCRRLPLVSEPGYKRSFTLAVGQNIYTPEDTKNSKLIENDRPYAGLTYFQMEISGQDSRRINSWAAVLGMIGPHSYAEETQRTAHEWNGWEAPEGWDNQLKDELVFNLLFFQRNKIMENTFAAGWGYDIVPNWGGGIGTLYTGVQAGAQIRFGWNLPNDFGTSLIRPGTNTNAVVDRNGQFDLKKPQKFSLYLFAGVDEFYCLRNLTLDGNTYQESHSVDKEAFVTSFMSGLGVTISRFKISFTHVYQTKEFKGQNHEEQFGSITLSYQL